MQPTSEPSTGPNRVAAIQQTASPMGATDENKTGGQKFRRWCYRGLVVLAVLLLLLGVAPRLISFRPCHDALLRLASRNINGHFSVERLRLGWLLPLSLQGFQIHPEEGPSLVVLPEFDSEAPLYRFWIKGTDLGTLVLKEPQVHLHVDPDGTNFAKTLVRPSPLVERVAKSMVNDHRFALQIDAGRFVFSRDARPAWSIDDIHTIVAFSPPTPADPSPHMSLPSGRLLDHLELSSSVCNDLLKFVAPVLADSAWVEGSVSLDFDHVDIPLRNPVAGELIGEMRIHAVRTGPGPLVARMAGLLGLPTETQLVDESVVHFTMQDGQVTHEGLEFLAGPVRVVTQGKIRLADESLDMMAELHFPEFDEETGPLRRALSGRTISVPIQGTLHEPKLGDGGELPADLTALLDPARQLLERSRLLGGEGVLGGARPLRDALDEARDGSDAAPRETPLLDLLRRRRSSDDPPHWPVPASADSMEADPENEEPVDGGAPGSDASGSDADESSPRRRLLPRLRRRD